MARVSAAHPGFFTERIEMNHIMKKNQKLSDALGVACVFLVFAGCAEGVDGGLTWWTPFCLVLAFVLGWLSKKTATA